MIVFCIHFSSRPFCPSLQATSIYCGIRTKSLPDKIPSAHFCIGGHNPSHVFLQRGHNPPTLFYKVDKIPSVNFPTRTKPLPAEIPYDSPNRSESYLATCYLAIILSFSSIAGKDTNCTNNCLEDPISCIDYFLQ